MKKRKQKPLLLLRFALFPFSYLRRTRPACHAVTSGHLSSVNKPNFISFLLHAVVMIFNYMPLFTGGIIITTNVQSVANIAFTEVFGST